MEILCRSARVANNAACADADEVRHILSHARLSPHLRHSRRAFSEDDDTRAHATMMPLATTIPHRATRFGARRRPHVARSSTRALENRRTSGVTFGYCAKKGRGRAVLARASAGRDREYYDWIDANGISAPCVGIGYVGGGIPDDNETYRGAVVVRPVARGERAATLSIG